MNFTKDQYDALMIHVHNDESFDMFAIQLMMVHNQNNVCMNDCIAYMETNDQFEEVDRALLYDYLIKSEKYRRVGTGMAAIVFNAVHLVNFIRRDDYVEKWQRYLSHAHNARIFWAKYDTSILDTIKQQSIVNQR